MRLVMSRRMAEASFIFRCFQLGTRSTTQFSRQLPVPFYRPVPVHVPRRSLVHVRSLSSSQNYSYDDKVKRDISMQNEDSGISPKPFDTLAMLKALRNSGFTEEQSEVLVSVLANVAVYSSEQALSGHVSHKTLDILELKLKGQIDSVRSEQLLLEKGTISRIEDRTESISSQTQRLRELIKEEVSKVQAGVQLDINLERSRNKENEALIQQSIKDAYHRIENEAGTLRTTIETQKLELVKYIAGGTVTLVTLLVSVLLGLFRLWK